jgi:small subunit ribosomal protein S1
MELSVPIESTEIKQKMHYTGKVVKISLAGALLDLGGGQFGVIHISQMVSPTDQPIKRVEDVMTVGKEVEVWVKKIREGRVELTMIKPLDLDWKDIKPGMTVKGKVVRLEKFGVFVEIGAERPGLVHISEMAHGYVRTPGDVVNEGDEVDAQVLEVNRRKKQIKLSLKALQPEPVKEEEEPVMETAMHDRGERTDRVPERGGERGGDRSQQRRRKPRRKDDMDEMTGEAVNAEATPAEPEPTAMEIAMRAAMERAKTRKPEDKARRQRAAASREQEDIFSRTLEHKSRTN